MFDRVLMVCVGNICRSPMAAGVLASRLAGRRGPSVESAGVAALVGRPPDPVARELMRQRGIDISHHRARQLVSEMIRASDLVLVMEDKLRLRVETIDPASRGKIHRLGRFGDFDVPDPVSGSRGSFELALALIERGVDDYRRAFWSGP